MGTTLIHVQKERIDLQQNRNTNIEIIKMLIIIRKKLVISIF